MGTFIVANIDQYVGQSLLKGLRSRFDDQRFMLHTYAHDVFEQYQRQALFNPAQELKITCVVFDSSMPFSAGSKPVITSGEEFAAQMRDLGYSGLLVHYGDRDITSISREHVNVSGLRDTMTLDDLVVRIKKAFLNPQNTCKRNEQGIDFQVINGPAR